MKNKWLDEPTEEGFWWRNDRADKTTAMTFVEVREKNPTFPYTIYFMNGRREELKPGATWPKIMWQKVKEPD